MGLSLEIHAIRPGNALDADEYAHALEALKKTKALLEHVLLVHCVLVEDKRRDNHVGAPKKRFRVVKS